MASWERWAAEVLIEAGWQARERVDSEGFRAWVRGDREAVADADRVVAVLERSVGELLRDIGWGEAVPSGAPEVWA